MKHLVILGDGMADRPVPSLGGKTPLQVAHKPNIDKLASHGEVGMVKTIPDDLPAGSDVANLSVMGYNPHEVYSGRSPLEAVSMGIDLTDTDTTFRANLVTLSDEPVYTDKTMIDYSAGEIASEEAALLIESLNKELKTDIIEFYHGISYRHLLLHKNFTKTYDLTPPHDISGQKIAEYLSLDFEILEIMKKSNEILQKNFPQSAANSVWLWGQGKKPQLPLFSQKYGKKGAVISAVDLIKGIAICSGMQSIDVPGATGTIHTNFDGKRQAVIDAFQNGTDFVYLHIEAPDECGHHFEVEEKIRSIELIDEKIVGPLASWLETSGHDYKILVMPDHPTPLDVGTHTHDPVPYAIFDSRRPSRSGRFYQESDEYPFFPYPGHKLMDYFINS